MLARGLAALAQRCDGVAACLRGLSVAAGQLPASSGPTQPCSGEVLIVVLGTVLRPPLTGAFGRGECLLHCSGATWTPGFRE